jgi:hypothetical protein
MRTIMSNNADISGVFQRPTLMDYLVVAESQKVDAGLNVYVGRLEVGLVGLSGGRVVYADMPGASGNTALSLLARLSNARIVINQWSAHLANVDRPWRELVGEPDPNAAVGRAQRLAEVRAELRELDSERESESGVYDRIENNTGDLGLARRVAAELLDWAVIDAYTSGDFEVSRELASAREIVAPGDLLAAANLERLRLRLLEDEFVSGVVGVQG